MVVRRGILTGILLVFVYQETGWATTTALFLVALQAELSTIAYTKLRKSLQDNQ